MENSNFDQSVLKFEFSKTEAFTEQSSRRLAKKQTYFLLILDGFFLAIFVIIVMLDFDITNLERKRKKFDVEVG
jgi:hypothetical protein